MDMEYIKDYPASNPEWNRYGIGIHKIYPASNPGWNGWMDGMDGMDGMHFFMYPYTHQSALSCVWPKNGNWTTQLVKELKSELGKSS